MNEPRPQSSETGSVEELTEYLEQLLKRDRFRKAPSLRHLLEYLVRKAAEGKGEEIKESTIAMDVFSKSHEFDGRLDNIVRVQAHRLRKILEAYYEAEGSGDKLWISIPKGSYIPAIQRRDEIAVSEPAVPTVGEPEIGPAPLPLTLPPPANPPRKGSWPALVAAFLAGALATTLLLIWAAPAWVTGRRAVGNEDPRKAPLVTFWGSLLQPGVNCVVSFTNPVFLWRSTAGNRVYFTYRGPLSVPVGTPVEISPTDPDIDPDLLKQGRTFFFSDSWTGTGEVLGIYRLTRLFAEAGHPLKVVRSRALTFGDLRDANVVFLGSPWANDLQDKVNPGPTPLVCMGTGMITNAEPKPGEQANYAPVYDARTKALTSSYALISVLPGVTPGTKIVSSAGIDTYGTAAGIDFLTSAAGVAELIRRFDPQRQRKLPEFFQAVIHTEIVRGDPAGSRLVLVREVERKSMGGDGHSPAR